MMRFFDWLWSLFLRGDTFSGAVDKQDERDFMDKAAGYSILPTRVHLLNLAREIFLNKTGSILTFVVQSTNSCTAYAAGIYKTILNLTKDGQVILFDEEVQWAHQEEEQGAKRSSGCTLQGALKILIKYAQGYPLAEYRRLVSGDITQMKRRLAQGTPIYTGVTWKRSLDGKSSNYAMMLLSGVWNFFKTALLGGHAIVIMGYDEEKQCFLAVEPMWKLWGANEIGEFDIPYSEVDNLMSMYVLYDMIDHD